MILSRGRFLLIVFLFCHSLVGNMGMSSEVVSDDILFDCALASWLNDLSGSGCDPQRNNFSSSSQSKKFATKDEVDAINRSVDGLDKHLSMYAVFITVLVTSLVIVSGFIQWNIMSRSAREIDVAKKSLEDSLETMRVSLDARFRERNLAFDAKLESTLDEMVGGLFKTRYEGLIAEYTKASARETLMLSPETRGIALARFRRMARELEVTPRLIKDRGPHVYSVLSSVIEDWHTLQQIYSPDREQIILGLGTFVAHPFAEAQQRLHQLEIRFNDDIEIYPLVSDALGQLERV